MPKKKKRSAQKPEKKKTDSGNETPSQADVEPPRQRLIPEGRGPLILLFAVITFGSTFFWFWFMQNQGVEQFGYEVVASYPHDSTSFTQGLLYKDGVLYESTGLEGQSKIRKVNLDDAELIANVDLADNLFGEGLCLIDDKLYQLTWKNEIGFIYDLELNELDQFEYEGQGWGLTYDGQFMIMSDGTSTIRFLDPENDMKVVRKLTVRRGNLPVSRINELEYIDGMIWANILNEDVIYQISPGDGSVHGRLDLTGLFPRGPARGSDAVLNGIALNTRTNNLLVTGKYWPRVYEIRLTRGQKPE